MARTLHTKVTALLVLALMVASLLHAGADLRLRAEGAELQAAAERGCPCALAALRGESCQHCDPAPSAGCCDQHEEGHRDAAPCHGQPDDDDAPRCPCGEGGCCVRVAAAPLVVVPPPALAGLTAAPRARAHADLSDQLTSGIAPAIDHPPRRS